MSFLKFCFAFVKDDILKKMSDLVTFSLNDTSGYKENLIKVEVFFEEFDFELMEEVPAYPVRRTEGRVLDREEHGVLFGQGGCSGDQF